MAVPRDTSDSPPEEETLIRPDASSAQGRSQFGGVLRRVVGGLAIVAGASAGVVAVLSASGRRQASGDVAADRLRKPFRLYDAGIPGALPMPDRADKYNGIEDKRPVKVVETDGSASVFVVGDWGATLPNHITYGTSDPNAQIMVADVIKNRAAWAKPQYVLNVGDNFYVEGLEHSCNDPPSAVSGNPEYGMRGVDAFTSGWQQIYGPVANVPWLSVLGNHDYGGWRMDKGWPQQIGYSFINYNWVMPARYFMKRIEHTGFAADYFMIDSNAYDAKDAGDNGAHNICSMHNNGGVGTCANNGGMANIGDCKAWFWRTYAEQKQWLEKKLAASDARWKVVVTHFPCGYDSSFYKGLKTKYGLDLLVTGHRHQQELWWPGTTSKYIQSFMQTNSWDASSPVCFVTGGGGGIASQKFSYADYGKDLLWYGFFHLTINKDWMNIELVGTDGKVSGNYTLYPHGTQKAQEAAVTGETKSHGICEVYCGDMNNPWGKVCRWGSEPWMSCGACEGCNTNKPGAPQQAPPPAAPQQAPPPAAPQQAPPPWDAATGTGGGR